MDDEKLYECGWCHEHKLLAQFTKGSDGNEINRCKLCVYLGKYNLNQKEYAAMIAQQNGMCAICSYVPRGIFPDVLCIDHAHLGPDYPMSVRGLLCQRCNLGIGIFMDNSGLLIHAAQYVDGNNTPFAPRHDTIIIRTKREDAISDSFHDTHMYIPRYMDSLMELACAVGKKEYGKTHKLIVKLYRDLTDYMRSQLPPEERD